MIARRIAAEGGSYLDLLVNGGEFDGARRRRSRSSACATTAADPRRAAPGAAAGPLRASLDRGDPSSPPWPRDNLDVAAPLIDRLAQPIEVDKVVVGGAIPPLEIFAIAVAATLTLAFVTVLLVAGSLALEREENAFPRLTRGLVSHSALLGREGPARGRASGWS